MRHRLGGAIAAGLIVAAALLLPHDWPGSDRQPDVAAVNELPTIAPLHLALSPDLAAGRSSQVIGDYAQSLMLDELDNLADDARRAGQALLACVWIDPGGDAVPAGHLEGQ